MYEFLEGSVFERSAARLILQVGGVAYDLSVPLLAAFTPGQVVRVWTHFAVREDAHRLFGFPDRVSRDLFRLLLKVKGVGPSLALAVLSGLSSDELAAAIEQGDVKRLTGVKGVGRKTAEQILLDLRDRVGLMQAREAAGAGDVATAGAARVNIEDVTQALVSIGYSEKDARRNVERASETVDPENIDELLRTALQG